MEKKVKKQQIRLEEMCVFSLAYKENVERIIMAVCSAGYFASVVNSSSTFLVYIYKRV